MTGLRTLFDIYKDAVFKKDAVMFASIFDDEVHVFDLWEWTFEGLPAWRAMAEGWFEWLGKSNENCAVEFSDIQTAEAGDMGYASAVVKYTGISESGESLRSLNNRLTWVAVKKNGAWKIIHEHTSAPADRETLKVIFERP
jgi:uncharacterized protein (TIGR02246 family)